MRSRKNPKYFGKQMKMNSQQSKLMGHREGSPERGVHSDTGLHKTDRNISNKQPNSMPTRTGGTTKPRVSKRKKIIKIRVQINDIETKKTIQKINETKRWFYENKNTMPNLLPDPSRIKER